MKRQYFQLILCLTFILFFGIIFSCRKENTTITIHGTVYDPNRKANVSGASVTISSSKISNGYYNSNYTDIATTTTDGNGNFSFQFQKEQSSGYRISITKTNYFDNTIDIPDANIVAGTTFTPTYDLYTKAYIKLHVKNNSPYDANDVIVYSYTSGYITCYECCSDTYFKGYGETFDSTSICKTHGNQNVVIYWHATKNSYDISHFDTLYCPSFDTTTYQILY